MSVQSQADLIVRRLEGASLLDQVAKWIEAIIVAWIGGLEESGYLGIFVLMAIESSFIPFPSEIVMIPAGVLASQGKLAVVPAIISGVLGSLAGAWFNYFFALWLGRPFLERYGKWFFVSPDSIKMADRVWAEHGELATFVCRLLPAIRQLISLPAGLARMNLFRFSLWTTLGAGLWVAVLTMTGYWLGPAAEKLWTEHKAAVTLGLFGFAALAIGAYLAYHFLLHRMLVPHAATAAGPDGAASQVAQSEEPAGDRS